MSVRPTKRGWVVIALAGISFLFALLHPTFAPAVFAAGVAALAVSSFATAFFSLSGVDIRRAGTSDGAVDKRLVLPLVVSNHSSLTKLPILVEEELPFLRQPQNQTPTPALAPNSEHLLERILFPARRGEYQLAGLRLLAGDPAGLFTCQRTVSLPCELLINPPSVPLAHLPLHLRQRRHPTNTGRPIGISGVGQEFFGLREYRAGDGCRFIHWPASAKHARLLIRQFEENSAKQVSLFVDTEECAISAPREDGPIDNLEFQIKTAATLTNYLAGTHCNLLFSAGNLQLADVRIDAAASRCADIIYHLACLQPDSRTMATQLGDCFELILPHSILYCLTLSQSPELLDQFDALQARGVDVRWLHAPAHAFAAPSSDSPPASSEASVQAINMEPEVNLAAVLANV